MQIITIKTTGSPSFAKLEKRKYRNVPSKASQINTIGSIEKMRDNIKAFLCGFVLNKTCSSVDNKLSIVTLSLGSALKYFSLNHATFSPFCLYIII